MRESALVGRSGRVFIRPDRSTALSLVQVLLLSLCIGLGGCGDEEKPTTPQGPTVTLLYPNGGEILQGGSAAQIRWSVSGHGTPAEALLIRLDLSTDTGSTWSSIADSIPNNSQGVFNWNIPTINTNEGRVRVTVRDGDRTARDMSDGNFTISYTPPPVRRNELGVEDREGSAGSEVTVGLVLDNEDRIRMVQTEIRYDPTVLEWISTDPAPRAEGMSMQSRVLQAGRLEIVITHDQPAFLDPGTGAIAALTFRLGGQADTTSLIEPDNSLLLDDEGEVVNVTERAGSITITGPPPNTPPVVTLISPVGGESWQAGSVREITWTAVDEETPQQDLVISLHYSTNGGGAWTLVATDEANDGTYDWTVPDTPTTRARVRVAASDGIDQAFASSQSDFTITAIPAGENTLTVGTAGGAPGTDVLVPLNLDNEDPVKGLQTDITFDPGVVDYVDGAATVRVGTMTFSASVPREGVLRVLMYYSDAAVLAPGTGAVANLTFRATGTAGSQTALTPESATLSDANADSLNVTTQAGSIAITGGGGNTLSVGSASGSSGDPVDVPLNLDNEDPVKGLQTDISFDPSVVEYVEGTTTARTGTMTYAAAVVGEGVLRIVLYYSDTSVLTPGSGAIADMTFTLIGAPGTQSALTPGSTVASGAGADSLEVADEAGSVTVLEKGGGR